MTNKINGNYSAKANQALYGKQYLESLTQDPDKLFFSGLVYRHTRSTLRNKKRSVSFMLRIVGIEKVRLENIIADERVDYLLSGNDLKAIEYIRQVAGSRVLDYCSLLDRDMQNAGFSESQQECFHLEHEPSLGSIRGLMMEMYALDLFVDTIEECETFIRLPYHRQEDVEGEKVKVSGEIDIVVFCNLEMLEYSLDVMDLNDELIISRNGDF